MGGAQGPLRCSNLRVILGSSKIPEAGWWTMLHPSRCERCRFFLRKVLLFLPAFLHAAVGSCQRSLMLRVPLLALSGGEHYHLLLSKATDSLFYIWLWEQSECFCTQQAPTWCRSVFFIYWHPFCKLSSLYSFCWTCFQSANPACRKQAALQYKNTETYQIFSVDTRKQTVRIIWQNSKNNTMQERWQTDRETCVWGKLWACGPSLQCYIVLCTNYC